MRETLSLSPLMEAEFRVGVIGGTGFVGSLLSPRLRASGFGAVAFSRGEFPDKIDENGVEWRKIDQTGIARTELADGNIELWVSAAPIWVLPDYFPLLEACGARRVVAVSSTSLFSKRDSPEPGEREIARKLAAAENRLKAWAEKKSIEWVVLRPTLIYGYGRDRNVTDLARFIRRFKFFPLPGRALGLRQPIRVDDVAEACIAALRKNGVGGKSYNLTGGETLTYREMVGRIFSAADLPARFVNIPLPVFRLAVKLARQLPGFGHWSYAMAERMNSDLVFDSSEAVSDLGLSPSDFVLRKEDLPQSTELKSN